jgi:ATP-dependent exoDNAse (exonuclease V) beta subunit
MRTPVPDQGTREEALDTSHSFILEAPAGSGKTALLTARFLALLAKVSHPRQIMAVTFTRKAAAEMADRITGVLRRVHNGGETSDDPWESFLNSLGRRVIERHRDYPEILKNPDTFQVGTFHGFCAAMVRAWPFEANVPPGVDVLEETDQESILERAVDHYMNDLISGHASREEIEACERRLASVNNNVRILSEQLVDLLRRRDRLEDFSPLFSYQGEGAVDRELRRRLEDYVSQYLDELRGYFLGREGDWVSLKNSLLRGGTSLVENFPESVPGVSLADIVLWKNAAGVFLTKSAGTPRKQFKTSDGFPKDFGKSPPGSFIKQLPEDIARLLAFVAGWPNPAEDSIGMDSLTDQLLLIGGALPRLEKLLHEHGLDYVELELAALRALKTADRPSESLIFYHEHLRHILVDEAQDLNDIQVKILGKLTEGWEPGDGRTVFFVGDPKQSIYRFRRAEVSLFDTLTENGLPREGEDSLKLAYLKLAANFRSLPQLVDFANRLFEQVMASPKEEYDEVRFACSEPAREGGDCPLPITAAVFYHEKDSRGEVLSPLEREAQWVAASITKLHEERPKDTIGILIRARKNLPVYIEALNAFGVPVHLMEGVPLLDRPEVRHLLSLFKALIRPYDDVAWASALRAPWLYVPNQVLCNLAAGQGIWSRRILSGQDNSPEVKKFSKVVGEAHKMFGRESYTSTLQRLWEDLDGPRLTASRFGPAGVSNVMAFLDLLSQCSGLAGEDALSKVNRLSEASYTPPDPKGALSPVHMMTIHKAKGLEFDHVFAVNLDYDPRGGKSPAYRMERLPGKERPLLIAAMGDRRTGEDNLAYYLLRDLDKQRTLAEARRLFYVVASRARESLTLTGMGNPAEVNTERIPQVPLEWLLVAYNLGILSIPEFILLCNPVPPEVTWSEKKTVHLSLAPPPFEAEPLPYRIVGPSKVEDETSLAVAPGAEEEDEHARARGVVIHRILDTLARGGNYPDIQAVAAALSEEGITVDKGSGMAEQVLHEAKGAWEAEEFCALRESAIELQSEWAIEDYDGEYDLRVGRIDLLVKAEDRWVIVDYKTGKPDEDVDSWLTSQKQHFRPQLSAYTQMVARGMNVPEDKVGWAILFTAIPRLVRQRE